MYYYQHQEDQIHFVWPCVHQINHIVLDTIQKGHILYAQWTIERTIGNLGQEIQQPSKPYANLLQEKVWCCKVSSLLSVIPKSMSHQKAFLKVLLTLEMGSHCYTNTIKTHKIQLECMHMLLLYFLKIIPCLISSDVQVYVFLMDR